MSWELEAGSRAASCELGHKLAAASCELPHHPARAGKLGLKPGKLDSCQAGKPTGKLEPAASWEAGKLKTAGKLESQIFDNVASWKIKLNLNKNKK